MRLLSVLAMVMMGCAPVVSVVREERPLEALAADATPVEVRPIETGLLLVDIIVLFTDSNRANEAAAAAVEQALVARGKVPTLHCNPPCPETRTVLTAGLTHTELTPADANGGFTGKVTLVVRRPGAAEVSIDRSAYLKGSGQAALDQALADAAAAYAARYEPTQQTDAFRLFEDDALGPANQRLLEGEPAAAAALYRQYLQAHPDALGAWDNLCAALTAAGDLQGAAEAAHAAADRDQTSMKRNRAFLAQEADRRLASTTRVLSFSTAK